MAPYLVSLLGWLITLSITAARLNGMKVETWPRVNLPNGLVGHVDYNSESMARRCRGSSQKVATSLQDDLCLNLNVLGDATSGDPAV